MRYLKTSGALLGGLCVLLAGCGGGGNKPIARVNDEKITKDEFYKRLELAAGKQALAAMINEKMQLQMAAKEGVAPTDQEVDEKINDLKQLDPNFEKSLASRNLTMDTLKQTVKVELAGFKVATKDMKVSDKEIEDFYKANKSTRFTRPDRAKIRGITVINKKDADEVKEMLKKGVDFATVAQMKSADTRTKGNGGDMGYITRNNTQIPPDIMKAAFTLAPGAYTKEPLVNRITNPETKNLVTIYSFIKVDEREKGEVLSLDKVRRTIREGLLQQKTLGTREKTEALQKKVQEFQLNTEVKVFSDRYKDLEKKKGEAVKNQPVQQPQQ
ncbi:MAG: peptidyl-prolyl cis-trans isomerase [Armatimonadetes bacterium]|nr:peptidyl-prolyl cis-trans isomerase [Armatimonadota bacterium]